MKTESHQFKPEPPETLRARLPKAIALIYDIDEVSKMPPEARPMMCNGAHIFDFKEGIRMGLTAEHIPEFDHANVIHASFSFNTEKMTLQQFEQRVSSIISEWFPPDRKHVRTDFSASAVHYAYELDEFARHFQVTPVHAPHPSA